MGITHPTSQPNQNTSGDLLREDSTMYSMSGVYRFFCWCSGANINVLRHFPTEYNKYFGTGSIVFMTGLFASVSASYAISTVFKGQSIIFPIITGLVWGMFIFFLDRYLVASMQKSGSFIRELGVASPRFVLALLIAVTIARPLELRIFKSEIQQVLEDDKEKMLLDTREEYRLRIGQERERANAEGQARGNSEITRLQADNERYRTLKSKSNAAVQAAVEAVQCECNGTCGTGKYGRGPACKKQEEELARVRAEREANLPKWNRVIAQNEVQIEELEEQRTTAMIIIQQQSDSIIVDLERQRDARLDAIESGEAFAESLLAQNTVLHEDLMKRPGVRWMVILITLLFVTLECAPILAKLMVPKGPYDDAMSDIEESLRYESRQRRFLAKQESMLNKGMIIDLSNSQKAILRKKIRQWTDDELSKAERKEEDRDYETEDGNDDTTE